MTESTLRIYPNEAGRLYVSVHIEHAAVSLWQLLCTLSAMCIRRFGASHRRIVVHAHTHGWTENPIRCHIIPTNGIKYRDMI